MVGVSGVGVGGRREVGGWWSGGDAEGVAVAADAAEAAKGVGILRLTGGGDSGAGWFFSRREVRGGGSDGG